MEAIIPLITDVGIRKAITANNAGVKLKLAQVAFGDANGAPYVPEMSATALRNERARVPIGNATDISDNEIMLEGILDIGPNFECRELGVFTDEGDLFAIWSYQEAPLFLNEVGTDYFFVYNLVLGAVPSGSVDVHIHGPSLNLTIVTPFALLSAEVIRAHRLGMEAELDRLKPIIENTWR